MFTKFTNDVDGTAYEVMPTCPPPTRPLREVGQGKNVMTVLGLPASLHVIDRIIRRIRVTSEIL
ncbi:hypothetical protein ET33_22850 [Paenibacillus tyrfis]|uniref:Uncharacterized protein n=1 Tax=Paenibacillus tyrfis TaxID=1501230 RepID=A0A081NVQ7_9BACL|nr:hypothetical protein ET33_22850 [Paenibacillus tyrfis]